MLIYFVESSELFSVFKMKWKNEKNLSILLLFVALFQIDVADEWGL